MRAPYDDDFGNGRGVLGFFPVHSMRILNVSQGDEAGSGRSVVQRIEVEIYLER